MPETIEYCWPRGRRAVTPRELRRRFPGYQIDGRRNYVVMGGKLYHRGSKRCTFLLPVLAEEAPKC